jgi:hypothetical protein
MSNFIKEGDEITAELSTVKEIKGFTLSDDQDVVKITKFTSGGSETMLVPVEAEGGIGGGVGKDLKWQALYGDLPSFDDDSQSPPSENDAKWE